METVVQNLAATELDDVEALGGKSDLAVYKYSIEEGGGRVTEEMVQQAETAPKTVPLELSHGTRRKQKNKKAPQASVSSIPVIEVESGDEEEEVTSPV